MRTIILRGDKVRNIDKKLKIYIGEKEEQMILLCLLICLMM